MHRFAHSLGLLQLTFHFLLPFFPCVRMGWGGQPSLDLQVSKPIFSFPSQRSLFSMACLPPYVHYFLNFSKPSCIFLGLTAGVWLLGKKQGNIQATIENRTQSPGIIFYSFKIFFFLFACDRDLKMGDPKAHPHLFCSFGFVCQHLSPVSTWRYERGWSAKGGFRMPLPSSCPLPPLSPTVPKASFSDK